MPEPIQSGAQKQELSHCDDTESAPYWLCYAMADDNRISEQTCDRLGDTECAQTSDCITEWCVPCAAKAWLRKQQQDSSVPSGNAANTATSSKYYVEVRENEVGEEYTVLFSPQGEEIGTQWGECALEDFAEQIAVYKSKTAPIPPKSSLPSKGALRAAEVMATQGCIKDIDKFSWARIIDESTGLPELLEALTELRDYYLEQTGLPAVKANAALSRAGADQNE